MVGYHKAAEMILLGEPFDAAAAVASGIANAICPDESVLATALATARKLATKPPTSLRLSKQLMKQAKPDVAAQMAAEGVHFSAQLQSDEAREAMTAFFEKRPRSEEHTSELQSLMRISYAVFCLKKKNRNTTTKTQHNS